MAASSSQRASSKRGLALSTHNSRRLGYAPKTVTGILLNAGQTLEQNITMQPATLQLQAVHTTASSERGSVNEALDWTPAASSPIAIGGLPTFTGKLATAAGTTVIGTAYVGAAQPNGTKWWQGWTTYARN